MLKLVVELCFAHQDISVDLIICLAVKPRGIATACLHQVVAARTLSGNSVLESVLSIGVSS